MLNNIITYIYAESADIKEGDFVYFGKFFCGYDFKKGYSDRFSEYFYDSFWDDVMWYFGRDYSIGSTDGTYEKLHIEWMTPPGDSHSFDLGDIRWKVIDIYDNTMILAYATPNPFHAPFYYDSYEHRYPVYSNWNESIVRSFLNGYNSEENSLNINYSKYGFLPIAFSKSEQDVIKEKIITTDNGISVKDKVFLLSGDEIKQYQNYFIAPYDDNVEYLLLDTNSENVVAFSSTKGNIHNIEDFADLYMKPCICVDLSKITVNDNIICINNKNISDWAKADIDESITKGIVPETLQSWYYDNITRKDFCFLAMQTYEEKTGKNIDLGMESPFTDVDNVYVNAAYNMKIVSGTGDNKFMPDNNITRQEAAVMLDNLAFVMNIDTNDNNMNVEKFTDEDMFADWARMAIYKTANIKSRDTFVLTGTGDGKFSPLSNYTREQAIVSMLRLFNCTENNKTENKDNNEYSKKEDIGCGIYLFENSKGMTGAINVSGDIIVRPEYKRPTSGRIFAVNNIFTLSDENNNYFVFDTTGKLIKKLHYDNADMDSDSGNVINTRYNITAVSGSNLVVEEQLEYIASEKSHTNQMCFIKRLVSEYTGENNIYDISAVSNGQFIARNKDNSYPCVLHLDGCKKFETKEDELCYIDRGFYYGYHQQDDEYLITIYNSSGNKIEWDIKEKVIEGTDLDLKESFKIDPENRLITFNTETNNIEVEY